MRGKFKDDTYKIYKTMCIMKPIGKKADFGSFLGEVKLLRIAISKTIRDTRYRKLGKC